MLRSPSQGALISLQSQYVLAALLDDLRSDGALATHGIEGDEAPLQFEQFQPFRNRRDCVGFLFRRLVGEHQAVRARPRPHPVQCPARALAITRAPRSLAIDGDHFIFRRFAHRLRPTAKAGVKTLRRHTRDDVGDAVVRRNAVGERRKPTQPVQLLFTKLFDGVPTLGTTGHRAHHQNEDIHPLVTRVAFNPRIFECREMFLATCRHEKLLRLFLAM